MGAGSITSDGSSLGASGCSVSSGAFCSVGGLTSASTSAGFSGCCSSTFTSAVSAGFSSTGAGYSSSFPMSSSFGSGYGILVVGISYAVGNLAFLYFPFVSLSLKPTGSLKLTEFLLAFFLYSNPGSS